MTSKEPRRYSIVFDKRDEATDADWPCEADAVMAADADIRALAEASEALRKPDRPVFTLS